MFEITEMDEVTILSVQGNLMAGKTDGFLRHFQEIEKSGKVHVVVNLDKCGYMSSSGLALLAQFKKRFMEKGGDLKVARITTVVRALFESANIFKVIEVFNSLESAVDSFQTKPEGPDI